MLELTIISNEQQRNSPQGRPSISIITVTFNAGAPLPTLIDSLRAQSDRNFEWIVVDGASTDTTIDLLKASGTSSALGFPNQISAFMMR